MIDLVDECDVCENEDTALKASAVAKAEFTV